MDSPRDKKLSFFEKKSSGIPEIKEGVVLANLSSDALHEFINNTIEELTKINYPKVSLAEVEKSIHSSENYFNSFLEIARATSDPELHQERLELAKKALMVLSGQLAHLGNAYLGFNIEGNLPDFKLDAVLGMKFLDKSLDYGKKQFAIFEELFSNLEEHRDFILNDILQEEVMNVFQLYLTKAMFYSGKHIIGSFTESVTEGPPGYTQTAEQKAYMAEFEKEILKIRDVDKAVQSCIDGLQFLAAASGLPNAPQKFNDFILNVIGQYARGAQNLISEQQKSASTIEEDRKGFVPR